MDSLPGLNDVTIVIVSYNSAHCIPDLAAALSAYPHVTVVDNASNDDTLAKVATLMPHAKVISNSKNLGFGAANNLALNAATTPYALLLNPDCLPEAGFAEALLAVAHAHPEAAIVAPHLANRDGSYAVNYRWPQSHWQPRGPGAEGVCCVGFVTGAAMLFNMRVMKEIGFFDEEYFLYYEDDDLCQRVFLNKKQIIVAPHVKVVHLSRGSVRGKAPMRSEYIRGYFHAQSKIIYTRKYRGGSAARRLRRKTLLLAMANMIPRLLLPSPRQVARLAGRIRGLWDLTPDQIGH